MGNKFDPILGEYRQEDTSAIIGANATTYFTFDGNTVYLYVNGVVRQTWTTILSNVDITNEDGTVITNEDGETIQREP